jgi:predicted thioesterase
VEHLQAGLTAVLDWVVADTDTAESLGSGDVPVLATPRLLAWLEAATVAAVAKELPAGSTSVGTRVEIQHERACLVGTAVRTTAVLAHVDGRLLRFTVGAEDDAGNRLAAGVVTRTAVDRDRFMQRIHNSSA